ncbi:MAG: branched-chain amino acid ABC transporter permease, partial [Planctomycetota bacterium]
GLVLNQVEEQMMDGLQVVILYGLISGSLYALVAIGYSLVYSLLGFVNFAHGELLTLGAYLFLVLAPETLGIGAVFVAIIAAVLIGVLATVIGLGLLSPARNQSRMAALVVAVGCSIVIQNVLNLTVSSEARAFPIWAGAKDPLFLGLNSLNIVSLLAVLILFATLWEIFFKRTRIGLEVRACATTPNAAKLWGLRIQLSYGIVFFISGAFAAIAGIAIAMDSQIVIPSLGFAFGLRAFIASVIGGLTSLRGAVAGSFFLGFVENLIGYLLVSVPSLTFMSAFVTKDVVALTLLVFFLLLRPQGIFATQTEARP